VAGTWNDHQAHAVARTFGRGRVLLDQRLWHVLLTRSPDEKLSGPERQKRSRRHSPVALADVGGSAAHQVGDDGGAAGLFHVRDVFEHVDRAGEVHDGANWQRVGNVQRTCSIDLSPGSCPHREMSAGGVADDNDLREIEAMRRRQRPQIVDRPPNVLVRARPAAA
jgi:hypothetical protein